MDIPSTKRRTARSTRNKTAEAFKKLPAALLLKKKAECDSRALKIVERMIEPNIEVDWLLESLAQINKAHMEDIVEERSIVKLCGYPLCDNPLKKIVNKQYQISTLRNKVYDVGRVKNFCSYRCFTATEYLMEQMLTSPLWHRDQEEIPKFQILAKSQSRSKSPPGVEVNLVGIQLPEDNDDEEETPMKKCVQTRQQPTNSCSKNSLLKKEPEMKKSKKKEATKEVRMIDEIPETDDKTIKTLGEKINISDTQIIDDSIIAISENMDGDEMHHQDLHIKSAEKKPVSTHSQEDKDRSMLAVEKAHVEEAQNNDRNPEANSNKAFVKFSTGVKKTERRKIKESKKPISFETVTTRVENSFKEWITEETICLLRGEDTEKQRILENARIEERYAILCKKLNHLQLEEERDNNDRIGELKPAPEFSALQEEAKGLELKVRAFYQGKTVIDRNEAKPEDKQPEVVLPIIDIHAPKALRRRIFLDKLNRVLPDLLRALGGNGQTSLSQYSYTSERCATVRTLVTTFSLSSTNITFKTPEWTLVALIIIKLLAFTDSQMKYLLASKQASMYTSMILMSYKLDSNYLERLVVSLITPSKTIEEIESTNS